MKHASSSSSSARTRSSSSGVERRGRLGVQHGHAGLGVARACPAPRSRAGARARRRRVGRPRGRPRRRGWSRRRRASAARAGPGRCPPGHDRPSVGTPMSIAGSVVRGRAAPAVRPAWCSSEASTTALRNPQGDRRVDAVAPVVVRLGRRGSAERRPAHPVAVAQADPQAGHGVDEGGRHPERGEPGAEIIGSAGSATGWGRARGRPPVGDPARQDP